MADITGPTGGRTGCSVRGTDNPMSDARTCLDVLVRTSGVETVT